MKITNYLLNQSSLVKNQLDKNHKLVKELILPKTQNYMNKDKNTSVYEVIHPRKNITQILKNENDLFIELYSKTKKLYPTKVEETFKDLILQYQNNDYKIPDLSDKKNLFNQNPLLLVGRDLDQFYMYNDKNKSNDIKVKEKLNRKHINFIKKEMLFMEKILNQNNEINKKDNNNLNNNNNHRDDEINYNNKKINYFLVDSVWDKIREQKLKQQEEKNKKRKKKEIKSSDKTIKNEKIYQNKNSKVNKSYEIINHNKNKNKINNNIDSYTTFYKYNSGGIKSNKDLLNLKSINFNDSLKKITSTDTAETNFSSFKNKNSKSISPIRTLKHKLLRNKIYNNIHNYNFNLFDNNEESIKLQKEINEIKNTLNNSDLIEKNIILESIPKRKSKTIKKTINLNRSLNKSINKKNFPLLLNNSEKYTNTNENTNNYMFAKKLSSPISPISPIPETDNNDKNNGKDKIKGINILHLIRRKTLPFLTLNKLLKETNPQKFLELLTKVDLKIFSRKDIEKLMKNYCEKVLEYSEKDAERIVNINRNDENIYKIIENIIQKTKKGKLKYYGRYSLKKHLDEVNNNIFDLKKKYFYGKTDYNYEA